jgi:hypothetical protein
MHTHAHVQVMKEMRVKGDLMDHKEVRAAIGVKIVAPGLETAVAGTSMFVVSVCFWGWGGGRSGCCVCLRCVCSAEACFIWTRT